MGSVWTNLCLAQERVQHLPQDRLQPGRDHVKGNVVAEAELVEALEVRVHLQVVLQDLEAVVEGDVQRAPHVLRDLPERSLSRLDLLVEELPLLGAAAVVVEEDVARVLHKDGAVKVLSQPLC